MRFFRSSVALLSLLLSNSLAQSIIESSSFGQNKRISPDGVSIAGWHISGEGHVLRILSDKIVLTPAYPGNKRGALWTQQPINEQEWTVEFQFRASGPERGGGNLQLWYTQQGQASVGHNSIYSVGKFDGLALVFDQHGGKGGGLRGFLNDGSIEYKTHHSVDSLAFGHCNYAYRNLGRPSTLRISYTSNDFLVSVDDAECFRSSNIKLPTGYYFGITAASAEKPDSFEAYKFITTKPAGRSRKDSQQRPDRFVAPPLPEKPPRQQPPQQQQQQQEKTTSGDNDARIAALESRIEALGSTLTRLTTSMDALVQRVKDAGAVSRKQGEESLSHTSQVLRKLEVLERHYHDLHKDVQGKDYRTELKKIQETLRDTRANLIDSLPSTLNEAILTNSPRLGLVLFILVAVQLALAVSYVVYKRRRANMPKKYL